MVEKLFFLHIPKTAGTSLLQMLEGNFKQEEIFPASQIPQAFGVSKEKTVDYNLFRGHFTYNLVDFLPDDVRVITFIREPIARTISHLKHVKFLTRHWLHKQLPLSQMSIDEMADEELVQQFIRDYQVRRIACDVDYSVEVQDKLILQEPKILDDGHLEIAKQRLEKAFFVGVTDRFNQSVEKLHNLLNWDIKQIPNINKLEERGDDEVVSEATLSLIEDLTILDNKLYNFANKIFEGK